jgi:hypothetical protein
MHWTSSLGEGKDEWHISFVTARYGDDSWVGSGLYGVMAYGQDVEITLIPGANHFEVNGTRVRRPPSDGFMYVVDSQLVLHKSPVTIERMQRRNLSSLGVPLGKDSLVNLLRPLLKQHRWNPQVDSLSTTSEEPLARE